MTERSKNYLYILIVVLAAIGGTYLLLWQINKLASEDTQSILKEQSLVTEKPEVDELKEWKTYRNEEYGFEFMYPEVWGPIKFAKSFANDIKLTSDIEKPDTGGKFKGVFENNKACGFSGVTADYQFSSSWKLYDSAGWVEKNGKYFSLWPKENIKKPDLEYNNEIVPDEISSVNGAKALLINFMPNNNSENNPYLLGYEVRYAHINLKGPVFFGLGIGCHGVDGAPKIREDDKKGLDQILSTFKFIE